MASTTLDWYSCATFGLRTAGLLRPRQVILSHHDDWLPGFSVPTDIEPIRAEIERTVPN